MFHRKKVSWYSTVDARHQLQHIRRFQTYEVLGLRLLNHFVAVLAPGRGLEPLSGKGAYGLVVMLLSKIWFEVSDHRHKSPLLMQSISVGRLTLASLAFVLDASAPGSGHRVERLVSFEDTTLLGLPARGSSEFQFAEVLVTREILTGILEWISRLRLAPG